jgi:hypothetical protein
MTRIVTYAHRYKRPPRKRKAVEIEGPAVVRKSESRDSGSADDVDIAAPSANDDRKPSIVTIKRKSRFGDAPDLTPEEHQRRGEAAAALWHELVGQATAKDEKSAAVLAESSSPATKPSILVISRKRRRGADGPHLPMELPLSRKPIERDGDDYKRLKAVMARRLRGE